MSDDAPKTENWKASIVRLPGPGERLGLRVTGTVHTSQLPNLHDAGASESDPKVRLLDLTLSSGGANKPDTKQVTFERSVGPTQPERVKIRCVIAERDVTRLSDRG